MEKVQSRGGTIGRGITLSIFTGASDFPDKKKPLLWKEAAFDSSVTGQSRSEEPLGQVLQVLRFDGASTIGLSSANGSIQDLINFLVQGPDRFAGGHHALGLDVGFDLAGDDQHFQLAAFGSAFLSGFLLCHMAPPCKKVTWFP